MKIDPRIDEPQKLSEIPRVERIEPSRDESLRHLSGRPTDLFDHAALEQGSSREHAIAHRADASFTSTGQGKTRDGRHPRGLRTCSILTLPSRADRKDHSPANRAHIRDADLILSMLALQFHPPFPDAAVPPV